MTAIRKIAASILASLYGPLGEMPRDVLRKTIGRLEGGQAFSTTLRYIMKKYHGISIGIGTYGPCFDLTQTWVGNGNLTIGKYCSLARGVCMYSRNHPYWNPSMSPLFYNTNFGGVNADTVQYHTLNIGNDVWIGQYALILPSCRVIGDGAVIGAGAVVTKNVPAYAVVVGNPARVIKYRFDKETIDWLEEIKWWDWDEQELRKASSYFQSMSKLRSYVASRNA